MAKHKYALYTCEIPVAGLGL